MPERSGDPQVPDHFGSKESEYQGLRESCGLIDTSARSILVLTGADRVRFLNGMVTGDIGSLQAGQGLYCFFTNARGRVLSDVLVLARSGRVDQIDQITLLLPPGMAAEIEAHLNKFVVADRVEIASTTDQVALRLLGPTSPSCLGERLVEDGLPEGLGQHQVVTIGDSEVLVLAENLGDLLGFTLLVKRNEAEALSRTLLDSANGQRISLCGSAAFESVRIETGTLQFGKDFTVDHFPKETVQSDGRDIGALSSATHSPLLERGIGLAILLRSGAEPNSQVCLADGLTAEVVELPFELSAC